MDNAGLETRCRYIYNTYEGVNPCWKIWWGMNSHHVYMSNTVLKPKVEPCGWHFVPLLKITFVKVVYFIRCLPVSISRISSYQSVRHKSCLSSPCSLKLSCPARAAIDWNSMFNCYNSYWSFLWTSIFEKGFTEIEGMLSTFSILFLRLVIHANIWLMFQHMAFLLVLSCHVIPISTDYKGCE